MGTLGVELRASLEELTAPLARVTTRRMFGCDAFLAGGAGERAEPGQEVVRQPQADPSLAPDHGEDGAAGEEGVAAEHPADRDLGEAGGEVVQPGAELEEQGAHAEERGGAGVYPVAGACLHRRQPGG